MALYFIILAIVSVIVLILGANSNLLKDPILDPEGFLKNATALNVKDPKPPFSLARTQLAFWTTIIFSSFLYLLFKYRFEIPELNNVNLILLGIAVGTTATGALIDDTQKNNGNLNQSFPSTNFFADITSDKSGVSIHRLQNVLWTIVVGIIYIQFVAAQGSLPDETVITNNLLILMGISSGTYVGVKTMENTKK
jgi:hypothetical protein